VSARPGVLAGAWADPRARAGLALIAVGVLLVGASHSKAPPAPESSE